jgi:drug/metabolite transporter (DMT)-like permease
MFMGALLLLAAVLTWGIGLMMSPHGQTVAQGTEHVRSTAVTFMLKDAVGTLVLCALAAWLLFPARRPAWPARDWALIVLLVFLAGSSLYTLIWLQTSVLH